MNEIDHLGASLLAEIAQAQDEAALEQVRIGALGKAGSISALLKTLGAMTPDERKEKGPLINGLRDQVQTALSARKEALAEAALIADPRLTVCHASFGDMAAELSALGITQVQGVLLDLGVSSPQIDNPERGFRFRHEAPLDLRRDTTPARSSTRSPRSSPTWASRSPRGPMSRPTTSTSPG